MQRGTSQGIVCRYVSPTGVRVHVSVQTFVCKNMKSKRKYVIACILLLSMWRVLGVSTAMLCKHLHAILLMDSNAYVCNVYILCWSSAGHSIAPEHVGRL